MFSKVTCEGRYLYHPPSASKQTDCVTLNIVALSPTGTVTAEVITACLRVSLDWRF